MARRKGDETEDIIGSRAKQAPVDLGPLFGEPSEPTPERKPGPAGKRYKEPPPSWDALRADNGSVLKPRQRMPESAVFGHPKVAPRSETSQAAADAIAPEHPTLIREVLQYFYTCGAAGSTRDECAHALGRRLSSVTARINELYVMGHIGSNCTEGCSTRCDHLVVSRINPETKLRNEVLVYETFVKRWRDDQSRPPAPLHSRRRQNEKGEADS